MAVYMVRGISLGKNFWVVNTWRALVRKRLNGSTLNLRTHFSKTAAQNLVRVFPNNEFFFFYFITRRALKAYFAWQQLKVDYSKKFWKEENRGHDTVCLLVGYISVKKHCYRCLERVKNCKLYILKKIGLNTFEEIL